MIEATSFSGTSVNFRWTTWGLMSQKMELLITTAVITSDRTHIIFQLIFCITGLSTALIRTPSSKCRPKTIRSVILFSEFRVCYMNFHVHNKVTSSAGTFQMFYVITTFRLPTDVRSYSRRAQTNISPS
jgi:hypothetical protein